MDKYEYKVRADEIKDLIAAGEYVQAAEIADTIDWRRVKSVMMLCTISDLYKINRRYEDAKNMLLLAYERRPGGRTICYALCELCIKTEEFVQAVNYYKEFVQVAPKDPARYILQYRLYEAQDVSLEERIGVLEELKKRDYREKWAYELAYLYHRVGLATKCVEECDELILWFGDGKYVIKAMELKMLHQPLDPAQQEKYDHRFDSPSHGAQQDEFSEEQESISAFLEDGDSGTDSVRVQSAEQAGYDSGAGDNAASVGGDTVVYENIRRAAQNQSGAEEGPKDETMDIHVKTMDMGKYNTINLQAELAAGLREVLDEEQSRSAAITRSIVAPMMETESLDYPELSDEDIDENDVDDGVEKIESTEVFFGETGELNGVKDEMPPHEPEPEEDAPSEHDMTSSQADVEDTGKASGDENAVTGVEDAAEDTTAKIIMDQLRMEKLGRAREQVMSAQPPREMADILAQEPDGQISLVVPERETVEKQITGQMDIQDVLAEWERMKQESSRRREEEVRQRVLQQTGSMFTEFEASVRDGLLEQLENGEVDDLPDGDEEPYEEDEGLSVNDEPDAETFDDTEETAEYESIAEAEYSVESEEASEEEIVTEPDANAEPEEASEEEIAAESDANAEPEETSEEETAAESEANAEPEEALEEETAAESEANAEPEEASEEETAAESDANAEPEETPEEETAAGSDANAEPEKASEEETAAGSEDKAEPEEASAQPEKPKVRALTKEERELYAPYIQSRSAREQLVNAIDNISLAAYTGNIIITGDDGMDTDTLAKNMIREVQLTDSNFSGKVARISGQSLNGQNVSEVLGKLKNGALIIQKAGGINDKTSADLYRELQRESLGIIVVMEDNKRAIQKLLQGNDDLASCFTARMNVEALSNDMLVAFGKQYAKEVEYSIDDLGVLALHTRIEERQTIDHAVTVLEVKQIVDGAIRHANRKNLKHFFDILMAKRYDKEDMIILTEKDFA